MSRCFKLLWDGKEGSYWSARCNNEATVLTPDGGHYCQEHDPRRIAEETAQRKVKVVRRLEHFGISPVLHSVSELSIVEQLLDLAEEQERRIEALQKVVSKTTRRKFGRS